MVARVSHERDYASQSRAELRPDCADGKGLLPLPQCSQMGNLGGPCQKIVKSWLRPLINDDTDLPSKLYGQSFLQQLLDFSLWNCVE